MWLSLLLWSASIVLPELPAHCLIVSRLIVFSFRCTILAQRLRSNRPFFRRVVSPFTDNAVPSVSSPVSSCVARSAFPSRLLRRLFPTRVSARSIPFSVSLCAIHPSFTPHPFVARFVLLNPPGPLSRVACLSVESRVAEKPVRRSLTFVAHFRRVIHYSVTFLLLFGGLIIKSLSFGFGITLFPRVCLKVTLH